MTSSRVTSPSALAIFADSAITAMVKATDRSGVARSLSKTAVSPSPLARAANASDMRDQSDMVVLYPACASLSEEFLHQHKIEPATKFLPDLWHMGDGFKAQRAMKGLARGVFAA